MSELSFRAANEADIERVVALVESAYRGDASRVGWTTEADLLDGRRTGRDDIEAILARERSRLLLAELDGELIACAHTIQKCSRRSLARAVYDRMRNRGVSSPSV